MLRRAVCGSGGSACACLAPSAFAATFTVTTTADSGAGSLRQAIPTPTPTCRGRRHDPVRPASLLRDHPDANLPAITDGVDSRRDARRGRQRRPAPADRRRHRSVRPASGSSSRFPSAAQAEVRGLTITSFGQYGLDLGTDAVSAAGNFIGTDSSGIDAASATAIGVVMSGASALGGNHRRRRNVISGNQVGIYVDGSGAVDPGQLHRHRSDRHVRDPEPQGVFLNSGTSTTIGGTSPVRATSSRGTLVGRFGIDPRDRHHDLREPDRHARPTEPRRSATPGPDQRQPDRDRQQHDRRHGGGEAKHDRVQPDRASSCKGTAAWRLRSGQHDLLERRERRLGIDLAPRAA